MKRQLLTLLLILLAGLQGASATVRYASPTDNQHLLAPRQPDGSLTGTPLLRRRTISVSQGYQTTGRGCRQALLLRMDYHGDKPIARLTFRLKGDTGKNIVGVQLLASDADELAADSLPKSLGMAWAAESVFFPLNRQDAQQPRRLWLTARVKDMAVLGQQIDAALTRIDYQDGTCWEVPDSVGNPEGEARIFATWSQPFVPTTDGCRFYRIPAMVTDRKGHLLVAADRRYDSNGDLGNHRIDVAVRKSSDNGRTWTPQHIIARGDGQSDDRFGYGDPALAVAPSGRIICVMAAGKKGYFQGMRNMGITTSDDNGTTWTPVRELTATGFRDAVHQLTDSLGFWSIFTSSGKGLTTADGTLLFTTNTLKAPGTYTTDCYLLSSNDEGRSWQLGPARAFANGDESKLAQLGDGRLLLSVRRRGARGFNTASSDGRQWGEQWNSDDMQNGNACNADIISYDAGTLLHTYLKHPTDRANLTLAMSTDNGRSWHDLMTIQHGGAAYSTMVKLPGGDVGILFEDESYTAGNGYALTFITIKRQQLHNN